MASYELYRAWMSMSYEQFNAATTQVTIKVFYLIVALVILLGWYIYTLIFFIKARMDKQTTKKFKKICKWEFRDPIKQEHIIIKEFIDRYTEEHKIDWSEYI